MREVFSHVLSSMRIKSIYSDIAAAAVKMSSRFPDWCATALSLKRPGPLLPFVVVAYCHTTFLLLAFVRRPPFAIPFLYHSLPPPADTISRPTKFSPRTPRNIEIPDRELCRPSPLIYETRRPSSLSWTRLPMPVATAPATAPETVQVQEAQAPRLTQPPPFLRAWSTFRTAARSCRCIHAALAESEAMASCSD